jgi:hypothetical protein
MEWMTRLSIAYSGIDGKRRQTGSVGLVKRGRKADDYSFALAWHKTFHAAAVFHHPWLGCDMETAGRLMEES